VLTVSSLADMQADTVSLAAAGWARVLGGLGTEGGSGESGAGGFEGDAERARTMLAGWDGNLHADSGPALLYGCFVRSLAEALYRPVLGDSVWEWVASGTLAPTINLVRRWLANDTWELLGGPVQCSPGQPAPTDLPGSPGQPAPTDLPGSPGQHRPTSRSARVLAVVPDALAAAWEAAVRLGGPDPTGWRWGDTHRAARLHPLGGELPATPMGGDSDTIQAAGFGWVTGTPFTVTSLSVYRQVIDLADPASASYVIPGGASGDPASPYFADQLALWTEHRRIPMR
jgi:penicillin amidase